MAATCRGVCGFQYSVSRTFDANDLGDGVLSATAVGKLPGALVHCVCRRDGCAFGNQRAQLLLQLLRCDYTWAGIWVEDGLDPAHVSALSFGSDGRQVCGKSQLARTADGFAAARAHG